MKLQLWHIIVGIIITGIFIGITTMPAKPHYTPHHCIDLTHNTCDGKCECDGLGCGISQGQGQWETDSDGVTRYYTPPTAIQYVAARDYQLELIEDSILVFDGTRYVGTIPMWDNSPLDSLLQRDNE